jgi:hypothetical protein
VSVRGVFVEGGGGWGSVHECVCVMGVYIGYMSDTLSPLSEHSEIRLILTSIHRHPDYFKSD